MRFCQILVIACGSSVACATAYAACPASIQPVEAMPTVQYDPFVDGSNAQTYDIVIANAGNAADCQLGLSIAEPVAAPNRFARAGASALTYRLFMNGRELGNDPAALAALPGSSGRTIHVPVQIAVPPGQIANAGVYSDTLVLRLVDMSQGQELGVPVLANLSIVMASRAQINLAGAALGGPADLGGSVLDFGALQSNLSRSAMLQVRSTAAIRLRVRSQHEGKMQRTGGGPQDSLAYTLTFDGEPMGLNGAGASVVRNAAASAAGQQYAVTVRIVGNPANLPAGDYLDVLTVDVSPQ